MITCKIDKLEPEFLAMVAMIESGIYDKDTYNRVEHWNNQEDVHHKFWKKFVDYLEFNGYNIVDSNDSED